MYEVRVRMVEVRIAWEAASKSSYRRSEKSSRREIIYDERSESQRRGVCDVRNCGEVGGAASRQGGGFHGIFGRRFAPRTPLTSLKVEGVASTHSGMEGVGRIFLIVASPLFLGTDICLMEEGGAPFTPMMANESDDFSCSERSESRGRMCLRR